MCLNCAPFQGLSALQYVDLNSSRNLYIVGFSLFFPLVLTRWMARHGGLIQTGFAALDAVLQVLLSTSILVGGATGCLLDNLLPGRLRTLSDRSEIATVRTTRVLSFVKSRTRKVLTPLYC